MKVYLCNICLHLTGFEMLREITNCMTCNPAPCSCKYTVTFIFWQNLVFILSCLGLNNH